MIKHTVLTFGADIFEIKDITIKYILFMLIW